MTARRHPLARKAVMKNPILVWYIATGVTLVAVIQILQAAGVVR